jgi:hypothetical protein
MYHRLHRVEGVESALGFVQECSCFGGVFKLKLDFSYRDSSIDEGILRGGCVDFLGQCLQKVQPLLVTYRMGKFLPRVQPKQCTYSCTRSKHSVQALPV